MGTSALHGSDGQGNTGRSADNPARTNGGTGKRHHETDKPARPCAATPGARTPSPYPDNNDNSRGRHCSGNHPTTPRRPKRGTSPGGRPTWRPTTGLGNPAYDPGLPPGDSHSFQPQPPVGSGIPPPDTGITPWATTKTPSNAGYLHLIMAIQQHQLSLISSYALPSSNGGPALKCIAALNRPSGP